ncbi:DUF29 domain-containing protein [Roseofilum reptotaenium CS-1145]|uniref:DUF29 domain-containing protein n=1 Tax=Roseofilum reptotaenium AO1-A TaxID=1925591 RepID=A0A1L9QQS3_9CYAN|nr:DUF29 domain-containing protein [Roseofilum reptotaenium]MDB9519675.1 DUF29 domain-containing protein [Roseofilum reptotaenium CS-1145]OJJ24993.1 hypothetical protein BI308_14035 [Roseofilum reptotaenium AO1-A]
MKTPTLPNLATLYDEDYQLWLETTLQQLRSGNFAQVDWQNVNVLDELESMAKRNRRAVKSLLTRLWENLLKLRYWESEREYSANKWKAEITTFRQQIRDELLDSPSLKSYLPEIFPETYQDAKSVISRLMDTSISSFPEVPPASLEEVLEDDCFFD